MNPNITFVTLFNQTWAVSDDWSSLLSLVREGTHYNWYSDEAEYYEDDYKFAYLYHLNNKWWVSEQFPFKEGGEMGLEELRDNRYCLGTELVQEALVDALCSIARKEWEQQHIQSCSPCNLYLDDIPF